MKTYLLPLVVLFLFSCNSSSENQQEIPKGKEPLPIQTANTLVIRDTNPQPRSSRVVKDTSRPKNEIAKTYPFDIALKSKDGELLNSKNILKSNGKPTVLLFWLTTCYPCRIEMAAIEKQFASWQKEAEFNIYAISTDFEKNFPRFGKMVEENKWPWPAYNDVNREFRKVMPGELNGLPQTFVFDAEGNIAYHKRKYASGDEHKLFAKVKELAQKK